MQDRSCSCMHAQRMEPRGVKEGPDARDFEGREIDVSALAEWIWTDVPAAECTRIGGTGTGRRFRAALSLDEVWQREERRGEERGNGRRGWERGREREREERFEETAPP